MEIGGISATLTMQVNAFQASVAAAIGSLKSFGEEALKMAAKAESAQYLVQAAFGDSAKQVEEWASNSADSLDQTKTAMLELASQASQMITPIQGAGATATKMSEDFAQFAAQLSRARGGTISASEAMGVLDQAMIGHTKHLGALIPGYSEAALQSEVFSAGLRGTFAELSQANKQIVIHNLVMGQYATVAAQAETASQGYADQLQKLGRHYDELLAQIGQYLIPYAEKLVAVGEKVIAFFRDMSPEVKKSAVEMGEAAVKFGGIGLVVLKVLPMILGMSSGFIIGAAAVASVVTAVILLKQHFADLDTSQIWKTIITGVNAISDAVFHFIGGALEQAAGFLDAMKQYAPKWLADKVDTSGMHAMADEMLAAQNTASDGLKETGRYLVTVGQGIGSSMMDAGKKLVEMFKNTPIGADLMKLLASIQSTSGGGGGPSASLGLPGGGGNIAGLAQVNTGGLNFGYNFSEIKSAEDAEVANVVARTRDLMEMGESIDGVNAYLKSFGLTSRETQKAADALGISLNAAQKTLAGQMTGGDLKGAGTTAFGMAAQDSGLGSASAASGIAGMAMSQLSNIFEILKNGLISLVESTAGVVAKAFLAEQRANKAVGTGVAAAGAAAAMSPMFSLVGPIIAVAAVMLFGPASPIAIALLALAPLILGLGLGIFMLSTETKSYANFQKVLSLAVDQLIKALEPLWQNLMPMAGEFFMVAQALSLVFSTLIPGQLIAKKMFDMFKVVGEAAINLALIFLDVRALMSDMVLGLMHMISDAGIHNYDSRTWDAATNDNSQAHGDVHAAMDIRQQLHDTTYDGMMAFTNSLLNAAGAANALSASMTNVPSGFRVAAARFNASQELGGGFGDNSAGTSRTGNNGENGALHVSGNLYIDVHGVTDWASLTEAIKRNAFVGTGSTGSTTNKRMSTSY